MLPSRLLVRRFRQSKLLSKNVKLKIWTKTLSTEAEMISKPKKRFRVFRSLFYTGLFGSTLYGAGVIYCYYQPQQVHNFLQENLPDWTYSKLSEYLPNENTVVTYESVKNATLPLLNEVYANIKQGYNFVQAKLAKPKTEEEARKSALQQELNHFVVEFGSLLEDAKDAYETAIKALSKHAAILELSIRDLKTEQDRELTLKDNAELINSFELKEKAEKVVDQKSDMAHEGLLKWHAVIESAKKVNMDVVEDESAYLNCLSKLESLKSRLILAQKEDATMAKYSDLVRQARDHFKKEIQAVISGKSDASLTVDDLNIMLAHAHRKIDRYQQQIAHNEIYTSDMVEKAKEDQKAIDEAAKEITVEANARKIIEELEAEFKIEKEQLEARYKDQILMELERQSAAHSEVLSAVVKQIREDMQSQFDREIKAYLLTERQHMTDEISNWIVEMNAVKTAIQNRADIDKSTREAQELWLACQTFSAVVSGVFDDDSAKNLTKLPPIKLDNEISAIKAKGFENLFVLKAVSLIPREVTENGVLTEEQLKARFKRVRKVGQQLAHVSAENASLFQTVFSHCRSWITPEPDPIISVYDAIDTEYLDNYQILSSAQYFLDNNNWEQAIRWMGLLHGQSKLAAKDWIRQARTLAATRQVADILVTHATANALSALF